jgi:hypothetical protein
MRRVGVEICLLRFGIGSVDMAKSEFGTGNPLRGLGVLG